MAKRDNKYKYSNPGKPAKQDNTWKLELCGLIGFCFSGIIFVASGIHNKDPLTVIGSVVWIASCLIWMYPFKKNLKKNDRSKTPSDDHADTPH